jgi:hypothetical protein
LWREESKSNRRIEAEVDLSPSCDAYELAVRLKVSLPVTNLKTLSALFLKLTPVMSGNAG